MKESLKSFIRLAYPNQNSKPSESRLRSRCRASRSSQRPWILLLRRSSNQAKNLLSQNQTNNW